MPHINAEIAARDLIKTDKLPIDFAPILKKMGIRVRSTRLGPYRAFYLFHRDNIIVVNKDFPVPEQRYGIARELGHHVLGHGVLRIRDKKPVPRPKIEVEQAKAFALELLMPKIAMKKYGFLAPEKIAEICVVPLRVAEEKVRLLGWV